MTRNLSACVFLKQLNSSLNMDKKVLRPVNTSYYNTNYQYSTVNKEGKSVFVIVSFVNFTGHILNR